MCTRRHRCSRTSGARPRARAPRCRAADASTPATSASPACGRRWRRRHHTTSCTRTRPSTCSSRPLPASTATLFEGRGDPGVGKARGMAPEELIAVVAASGLRGRGGAGYPLADKLRAVVAAAKQDDRETLLVANAYDADPDSPLARTLIMRSRANVLQGVAIAAHAIGAREAIIYMHPQADDARKSMEEDIVVRRGGLAPLTVTV